MSVESGTQTKDWHSSKKIRKRACYILEHPDEQIPSDVTFLVGDGQKEPKKIFKCHKFVLALVSSMFQAMFYGTFPQLEGTIEIRDITPAAFQNLLNYAYADDLVGLHMDNIMETLYCAKRYMIGKLERAFRDFVQENIIAGGRLEGICCVFEHALSLEEDNLAAIAMAEVSRQTVAVFQSDEFLDLSPQSLRILLEQDKQSASEPTIYEHVCRWAQHSALDALTSLRKMLGPLLYCIRFPLFGSRELLTRLSKAAVLTTAEERDLYRYLLADADIKPVIPFLALPRTPPTVPWVCKVTVFDENNRHRGEASIQMRPDSAPECCQLLKDLVQGNYPMQFGGISNSFRGKDMPERSSVLGERNGVSHSANGAVWFQWNASGTVRLLAWSRPRISDSAVFGHVMGSSIWPEDFTCFQRLFSSRGHVVIQYLLSP